MTTPTWLIAEREFRTYVATASFWVALAIGPIAGIGGLLLSEMPKHPEKVFVQSDDASVRQAATAALQESGNLEGRHYAFGKAGARLLLSGSSSNLMIASFDASFPLSETGRALFIRTLERDAARRKFGGTPPIVREISPVIVSHGPDAASVSRFALVMLLWLALTGSLGMLLQSVVRERANRALESLLASARPWEIIFGKLLGVGAISVLVLSTWLGSAVALSALMPSGGAASAVLFNLSAPALLIRTCLIYVLAYGFYGSITMVLGALARDGAAAQNLSRPMFIMLLAAFLVALGSMSTADNSMLSWLVYVPPFAPFLLLLSPPSAVALLPQILILGLLVVASLGMFAFATSRLSYSGPSLR
jgi:ABC-2 type transport system permease protein